jgi:hypothetical protein
MFLDQVVTGMLPMGSPQMEMIRNGVAASEKLIGKAAGLQAQKIQGAG